MRQSKKQNLKNAIAVIVDGKDEKWYIEDGQGVSEMNLLFDFFLQLDRKK